MVELLSILHVLSPNSACSIGKHAPKVAPLVPRVGQRVDTVTDTGPAPMQVEASAPAITTSSDATFDVQPLLNGHLPDVIQV